MSLAGLCDQLIECQCSRMWQSGVDLSLLRKSISLTTLRYGKSLKLLFKKNRSTSGRIIVCESWNLIYIRVPKSGNTSICKALKGGMEKKVDLGKLQDYVGKYTVFSFVRNPWARLVSAYNDKVQSGHADKTNAAKRLSVIDSRFCVGMQFEEFAELVCDLSDSKTEKHIKSQSYFLVRQGRLVPDFIGRIESMDSDWHRLQQQIGFSFEVGHSNRTRSKGSYRDYYKSSRIKNLVGDRYASDVDLFNYDFDGS